MPGQSRSSSSATFLHFLLNFFTMFSICSVTRMTSLHGHHYCISVLFFLMNFHWEIFPTLSLNQKKSDMVDSSWILSLLFCREMWLPAQFIKFCNVSWLTFLVYIMTTSCSQWLKNIYFGYFRRDFIPLYKYIALFQYVWNWGTG